MVLKHALLIVACVVHVKSAEEPSDGLCRQLCEVRRQSWMQLTQPERRQAKLKAQDIINQIREDTPA